MFYLMITQYIGFICWVSAKCCIPSNGFYKNSSVVLERHTKISMIWKTIIMRCAAGPAGVDFGAAEKRAWETRILPSVLGVI